MPVWRRNDCLSAGALHLAATQAYVTLLLAVARAGCDHLRLGLSALITRTPPHNSEKQLLLEAQLRSAAVQLGGDAPVLRQIGGIVRIQEIESDCSYHLTSANGAIIVPGKTGDGKL